MTSSKPAPGLEPSLAALTLFHGVRDGNDGEDDHAGGDTSPLVDLVPQAVPDLLVGSSRSSSTSSSSAPAAAAAAAALAPNPADEIVARRVVAQWRAFVVQGTACPMLDLLETFPDLFMKEVLERLDLTDRTMVAQVGRPWLAAVLASGLPRLPNDGYTVRLRLAEFCTSVDRLTWAKANGCLLAGGAFAYSVRPRTDHHIVAKNCCALAAQGGHLEVLQWLREQNPPCPWSELACARAAWGGHLDVLRWARERGTGLHSFTSQLNLSVFLG